MSVRPFESSELGSRLALFLAPFVVAGLLIVTRVVDVTIARGLTGAGLGLAAVGLATAAPWRRLPTGAQIVPPLLALAAIAAVIAGDETPGTSPLAVLVIGPVLWLALYHDPAQVWVGVAGAGCAVAAGNALAGQDTATSVASAALTIGATSVLAVMTIRLLEAERRAAATTRDERDQHRVVLDHLPNTAIAHMNREMRWVSVDGGANPIPRDELIGRRYDETVPPTEGDRLRPAYLKALEGIESRLDHRSPNTGQTYDIQVLPVRDADGTVTGAISVARDITDERAAAGRLAASERDHRLLTESARDMISRHDAAGVFLYVSAACRDLLGYEPEEMLGRPGRDFTVAEDQGLLDRGRARLMTLGYATNEFRMRRKDGELVWVEQRVRLAGDEVHSTIRDVTDRRESDRQLAHLATHDDLTRLWNRRRFNEALREELARAHRRGPDAVMLLIDLDDFKRVNDTHGHAAGDRLLTATADAIRSRMREGDAGGRLGGDEFAVLLRGTAPEQAEHVAEVYGEAIEAASIELDGGGTLSPSASVGWAVVAADALDERSVLAGADAAMYRQKARRRESA